MSELVMCNSINCNETCVHKGIHEINEDCSNVCTVHKCGVCISIESEKIVSKWAAFNKSCEYHGQNIEIEVLDTWVYPKSKIIELRCIDVCKQCGEGYGSVYTLFADKFVKEV